MRIFTSKSFFHRSADQASLPSLLTSSAKALLSLALILVALGVVALLFPFILALIVAIMLFAAALTCLRFAWKILRAGRSTRQSRRQVDVITYDSPENVTPDDSL